MIDFCFAQSCYSCSACGDSCPEKAITYDGNLHPVVDKNKCVQCGLCEKVCIAGNQPKQIDVTVKAKGYVVKNKDDRIRKSSSSGGVFIQLAQAVIGAGGYVCGCIYDDRLMPRHIVTDNFVVCQKMMGSKYVKSDMDGCISQIRELTNNGTTVLFTGVPCQVAAIRRCISSEKLLTLAVVCHGSIERDVWEKYLDEESVKGTIIDVTMRDKSRGYLNYGLKFTFDDGSEHITFRSQDGYFLKSFTDGLLERDRCLACAYKGAYIDSDLLLGDAWGMDKLFPDFTDDLGCSVVMILTSKGAALFENVKDYFVMQDVDSTMIIASNQRIITPAPENPCRSSFQKKLYKQGTNVHQLTRKYAEPTVWNRIKWKVAKQLQKARNGR